ncbi:long-chain-fatty-acid-CoA ligase [Geomicrobium sp. JCM 19037]|uniref:AMP-binding protein n=1 Tax=Geomicrobium sp. JCM 19037 TaxID=1460634 RepID=UPI00045F14BF|nr:AMP-binding protein [Geomicrobium sp. JCM 19037]GAK05161.1 long-chain-fatty-acid-CoA ligase [Geomicrobium sp. JCM 19037]
MVNGMHIHEERKAHYYERGHWQTRTVYETFLKAVQSNPTQVAVIDPYRSITYEQLRTFSTEIANGFLVKGLKKGDVVSVQLPNWIEYVAIYLACTKIGVIFTPIPVNATAKEVANMFTISRPALHISVCHFRKKAYEPILNEVAHSVNLPDVYLLEQEGESVQDRRFLPFHLLPVDKHVDAPDVHADDALVILFTSGTESLPKGVVHTHNTVLFGEKAMQKALNITEDDRVFMASPLSHATGFLHAVNLPLITGATSVLMDHFQGEKAVRVIERQKCTFSMGAATFVHDILKAIQQQGNPGALSTLRFFLCGGAPIPRHLVDEAKENGFRLLSVYGASESPPHAISCLHDSEEWVSQTDGQVLEGIDAKVVDDDRKSLATDEIGELATRGPNVFVGYFNDPSLTRKYLDERGWYYSGDLGTLDSDRYVRVVGRKKDMIIRGGQNISPVEVENLLLQHASIKEVALVGVPDERMGEKACAFITLNPNGTFTYEMMVTYLEEQNVAKYKWPEYIELVPELARTASGKIQKFRLLEQWKTKIV